MSQSNILNQEGSSQKVLQSQEHEQDDQAELNAQHNHSSDSSGIFFVTNPRLFKEAPISDETFAKIQVNPENFFEARESKLNEFQGAMLKDAVQREECKTMLKCLQIAGVRDIDKMTREIEISIESLLKRLTAGLIEVDQNAKHIQKQVEAVAAENLPVEKAILKLESRVAYIEKEIGIYEENPEEPPPQNQNS